MPSIIGSSIIPGNYGSKGITGLTGITGISGNTGLTGITKGNTGSTGTWINSVSSDLDLNQISFTINDGSNYTFTGFTGSTGTWSDSRGISGEFGATAFTPFKNVNGNTFNFYGLSAGANASISLENDQAVVRFTSSASYGISAFAGYVPFINGISLQSTKIYVDSNNTLNLGLTANPSNNPLLTPLFKQTKQKIKSITGIGTTDIANNVLDLSQASVFELVGPIGITAFINGNTLSNTRQEYTLIFNNNNGPVLNLPKNLYFSNNESTGIEKANITGTGLSIVNIWSDNGGITFNAAIIARNINDSTNNPTISDWGSCCTGTECIDNISYQECRNKYSGKFFALTPCSSRKNETGCSSSVTLIPANGVCCCGITGCIDYTNAPYERPIVITDPIGGTSTTIDTAIIGKRVSVTKTWCDSIGGTFKPLANKCGTYDKYPGYISTTRRTNKNTDPKTPNLVCPNGCLDPVTCCVDNGDGTYTTTQETEYYCQSILHGIPVYKTVAEVSADGGCGSVLEPGWCRKNGACTQSTRSTCNECGSFFSTQQDCENGEISQKPILTIDTPTPVINVVHSIDQTKTETLVRYSSTSIATSLDFTLINAPSNTKYLIGGKIKILDNSVFPKEISIWNSNCFGISITKEGSEIGETDVFSNSSQFSLTINSSIAKCISEYGDVDFAADLILYPISCTDGSLETTSSITIPLNYTKSPCSCLAIGGAGKGITGDILNKYPVTIPFTATRYCTHCTKREMRADFGSSGNLYVQHIPYPLKTQTGFVTFCPNTLNFIDGSRSCELPVYWCVRYGRINELSGCTYSSLFDIDGDNLVLNDKETNTQTDTPLCYHAEYNEINILDNPTTGTTYWFSGDWNYIDVYDPTYTPRVNIRSCRPECRIKLPASTCAIDPEAPVSQCGTNDAYSTCCRTCPGTPLFVSDSIALQDPVCGDPTDPLSGWVCQDYQPYFNIITLDKNVLNSVAETYGIDVGQLQEFIQYKLQNYADVMDTPGENPVVLRRSELFNPLMQEKQTISGPTLGTEQLDPDNLAKASCEKCKDKFNKDQVIQVIYPGDDVTFKNTSYDIYGIVIAKETTCTETGGFFSGKDGELPCSQNKPECTGTQPLTQVSFGTCPPISTTLYEYKYYIVVIKDNNTCINVFNIGSTDEIYKDIGSSNYLSGCGGGSLLCNTDCGNGAQLKEVKWFGTLDTNQTYAPGFCTLSRKVPYIIKKDLNGIVPSGTGLQSLDSIIEFTTLLTTASATTKLQNLGNMLKNIFGKEKPEDYLSKICIPCSQTDERGEKGCSINVIPELIEFIGKNCYISGFDSVSGSFDTDTLVYDNTNNINQVTLQNNGINKPVIWLTEGDFRNQSALDWGVLNNTATATISIHNMWSNKYATGTDQLCSLAQNSIDNRWLKNNNLSYLEVKNNSIVKRKIIYQAPETGLILSGLIYSLAAGPGIAGKAVSNTSGTGNWYNQKLYFDTCSINPDPVSASKGVTVTTVKKHIPKVDLNNLRPVSKIGYSTLYYPAEGTGTPYEFRIKFLSSLSGMLTKKYCAIKILYTDGTKIHDITDQFKQIFGLNAASYIIVDLYGNGAIEPNELLQNITSGTNYVYHSISNFNISPSITVPINGSNISIETLLKSGNCYVLARESVKGGALQKIMYSNYLDWERTEVVPKADPNDGILFLEQFNVYGSHSDDACDIVLEDYALSRIIPIEGDPEFAIIRPEFRTTQLKNKYINGMCISVDCTNSPDLCSNLTDC